MLILAIGAAVVALLVGLGRKPLAGHLQWRLLGAALALAAAAAGVWASLRGGWTDGLLLFAAATYLAFATRAPGKIAPPAATDGMGAAEARAMLGVGEGASRLEIEAAYRRLILRVHPDRGGAPGLAAELNAARETLLG